MITIEPEMEIPECLHDALGIDHNRWLDIGELVTSLETPDKYIAQAIIEISTSDFELIEKVYAAFRLGERQALSSILSEEEQHNINEIGGPIVRHYLE